MFKFFPAPPDGATTDRADPAGKHHTSSCHAYVRGSISTKVCMMIEVVRAIISPQTFLGPIHSFAARGRRKFG